MGFSLKSIVGSAIPGASLLLGGDGGGGMGGLVGGAMSQLEEKKRLQEKERTRRLPRALGGQGFSGALPYRQPRGGFSSFADRGYGRPRYAPQMPSRQPSRQSFQGMRSLPRGGAGFQNKLAQMLMERRRGGGGMLGNAVGAARRPQMDINQLARAIPFAGLGW